MYKYYVIRDNYKYNNIIFRRQYWCYKTCMLVTIERGSVQFKMVFCNMHKCMKPVCINDNYLGTM